VSQVQGSRFSRRELVGGAAATAAGMALPEAADARRRRRRRRTRSADVAIVGAGLAGLVAARELTRAGKDVIVLEARNRVGGRMYSKSLGPGATDVANMGATFIGPTQRRILALARELGVGIFDTYNTGKNVSYFGGSRGTYSGAVPLINPAALAEAQLAIVQFDDMAKEVPLDAPWRAERAEEWDGKTVETWKLENVHSSDGRKLIDLAIRAILSVEAREVSLLFWLFYVRSAGSVEQLINTAGGAQQYRVEGGTQLISDELARRLGRRRLIRRAYVTRIARRRGRLEVQSSRAVVRAKRVIVAIPPAMAARIDYSPRLPALRDQFTQRAPIGSLIKTIAVYDTPFWRDDGLTGQVTSDEGPIEVTFDASPKSGRPGVMLGFVDGDAARVLSAKSHAERVQEELQSLARYFGPKALRPKAAFDYPWDNDRYARGCPVAVLPPGALLSFGRAIREPAGGIHWAGAETATEWHGYMDGAVQSGERAAKEVLAAL
jgi:monoamine oxidase